MILSPTTVLFLVELLWHKKLKKIIIKKIFSEVFSGSVSQTEEIIDKHNKTMDKIDKKAKVSIDNRQKAMVLKEKINEKA